MAEQIGVRELRSDLAAQVRRAAAGHRIVVTVGGRAAASLGPLGPPDGGDPTLDALVAAGLVVPPRRSDVRGAADEPPSDAPDA